MYVAALLVALNGYLLGNLNGAVSISRIFGKKDVRDHGSGNAGLTNFLRLYGWSNALLVICIDMFKALIACVIGKLLLEPYGMGREGMLLGGLAVNIGHDFPALLGFRGGKGVLCGITAALAADWTCGVLVILIFTIFLFLTRYVSLSSILGALTFILVYPIRYSHKYYEVALAVLLGVLIIFMHRSNISRLLKGNERKVSFKKKAYKRSSHRH